MNDVTWAAQWIWDGGDPAPTNAYRIFTKTFTLPEDSSPEQMTARLCADTRYVLHVNGRTIERGPAPHPPGMYAYDELDLKFDLNPRGENRITIVVHYIGAPTFAHYQHRGGLLFEMGDIVSDETWLVAKFSPWQSDAPRLTVQQGFSECYDARAEPFGLYLEETDPAEWAPAVVICPAEGGEWDVLEPRGIPMPETIYRPCETLLEWGNCTPGPGETVAEQMTTEVLRPLTRGRFTRQEWGPITLTPDGEDMSLLFDFGEQVSGFLDFDIDAEDGAKGGLVDIGYDEAMRVGETPSGLKHDWGLNGGVRHAYADRLILRDGEQTFQNFSHRAFRYVRLAFRNLQAPVTLDCIGVYESTYPVNRRGAFTCSDARLDKIWEVGRRTLQLCMDDKFMDCPWRERAQWIGDAKVEALGALYCFGDTKLHRRFLKQTAQAQFSDGHTDPVGPGEWDVYSPGRPIPGFTAIWVHSIWDYFQMTDDRAFCAEMYPAVRAAVDWLGCYGTEQGGLLCDVPGWNFTDWAPGLVGSDDEGRQGIMAPVNLFYYHALLVASALAAMAGVETESQELGVRATHLADAFDALFWEDARSVYVDNVREGRRQEQASQHTNSLALLYEIGSRERRDSILHHLLEDPSLLQVGSPYFSFYLLGALYKEGRHTSALAYIRRHWGAMLDAGATTWWEEYHGQTSRCHAWSIGPTIDLQAEVLGVRPAAPGFGTVEIAPHPCDLSWATGVVPTPVGDIGVSWQRTAQTFTLHVSAPTAIHIKVILPARPGDNLLVNSQPIAEDAIAGRTDVSVALNPMPGGGSVWQVHAGPG